MSEYRKLIMAVVGVGAMLLEQYAGVGLGSGTEALVTQGLIGLLTSLGVWGVPNTRSGE